MKKLSISLFFLISLIGLSLVAWFFFVVPIKDINKLKEQYVAVDYKDAKVNYKIVKKRPKRWVNIEDMDHHAIHAIVVSEDWAFYQHSGHDLNQIKEAMVEATKGQRTRGASTITQQLVKNLFLTPDKSLNRKIKEFVISSYLERKLSKKRILEIYLNIIEFGKGLYGIKDASQFYFKKNVKKLNAREGAFMAMVLPSPKRYSESFRKKSLTPYAEKTIDNILNKMVRAKYLKKSEKNNLKQRKLNFVKPKKFKDGNVIKSIVKKGLSDGSEFENSAKIDQDLVIDDHPDFGDEMVIQDTSGLEEEFRVE